MKCHEWNGGGKILSFHFETISRFWLAFWLVADIGHKAVCPISTRYRFIKRYHFIKRYRVMLGGSVARADGKVSLQLESRMLAKG